MLHITTNGQATQVVELRGNNPSGRGAQRWRGDGRCLIAGVVADEGGEAAWIGDAVTEAQGIAVEGGGKVQAAAVFLAVADHAGAELCDGIILADIAIVGVCAVQRGDASDLAERIVGANLATANGCAGGEAVAIRVIGPGEGLVVGGGEAGAEIASHVRVHRVTIGEVGFGLGGSAGASVFQSSVFLRVLMVPISDKRSNTNLPSLVAASITQGEASVSFGELLHSGKQEPVTTPIARQILHRHCARWLRIVLAGNGYDAFVESLRCGAIALEVALKRGAGRRAVRLGAN